MKNYKRIKVFTIPEVESLIKEDVDSWDGNPFSGGEKQKNQEHNIKVEGYDVYTRSLRYKTFIKDNYKCVCCGRTGTYYALEWGCGNEKRAHFNLYSDDNVLMTKDHIYPKCKGGKDIIDNMQTMCIVCNNNKGDDIPNEYSDNCVKIKKENNREYVWCGNKKYRSIETAAKEIGKGNEKTIEKVKGKIRDSIKNGSSYCGVVWRYGKEL